MNMMNRMAQLANRLSLININLGMQNYREVKLFDFNGDMLYIYPQPKIEQAGLLLGKRRQFSFLTENIQMTGQDLIVTLARVYPVWQLRRYQWELSDDTGDKKWYTCEYLDTSTSPIEYYAYLVPRSER